MNTEGELLNFYFWPGPYFLCSRANAKPKYDYFGCFISDGNWYVRLFTFNVRSFKR